MLRFISLSIVLIIFYNFGLTGLFWVLSFLIINQLRFRLNNGYWE